MGWRWSLPTALLLSGLAGAALAERSTDPGACITLDDRPCYDERAPVPSEPNPAIAAMERHLPLALKYIRDQAEAGNCKSAWASANASGHPRLQYEARARCGEPPRTETPPAAPLIELW